MPNKLSMIYPNNFKAKMKDLQNKYKIWEKMQDSSWKDKKIIGNKWQVNIINKLTIYTNKYRTLTLNTNKL